jgi:hypothetical protein
VKIEKTVSIPAKPAKPARTKKVEIYKCDFCEAAIDKSLDNHYGSGASACRVCSRDVCRKCLIRIFDDWSDDPADHYCPVCNNLMFNVYMETRSDIEAKYHRAIEALDKKIKKESLKWQNEEKQ